MRIRKISELINTKKIDHILMSDIDKDFNKITNSNRGIQKQKGDFDKVYYIQLIENAVKYNPQMKD
ncbi:unnamed protein product [Paramecium sonneborni]|uniref:Uncharacterized protein n=1 Tax=Paramecium sonneborni TaxID=65129 RepID=A0A8S1MAK2_9CILI|nr:unnamed protein product [Paramecium sonneborni]